MGLCRRVGAGEGGEGGFVEGSPEMAGVEER